MLSKRTVALWAAAFIGSWLFVGKVYWDFSARRQAVQMYAPPFASALDPKIGSFVKLPRTDLLGREIGTPRGSILIVTPGGCYGCSLKVFDPRNIDVGRYAQIVVIYSVQSSEISREFTNYDPKLRVIADAELQWLGPLNATAIVPRFYLLDSKNVLTQLGASPPHVPEFVTLRTVR